MEPGNDMEVDEVFEFDDKINTIQDQVQQYISTVGDAIEYIQKYSIPENLPNEKSMANSQYDVERK